MLVEQFRITDIYHPPHSTVVPYVSSPTYIGAWCLCVRLFVPVRQNMTQSEPSTRQAPILLPRYTQQRTNRKLDARGCELGAQHTEEGHGFAKIVGSAWYGYAGRFNQGHICTWKCCGGGWCGGGYGAHSHPKRATSYSLALILDPEADPGDPAVHGVGIGS